MGYIIETVLPTDENPDAALGIKVASTNQSVFTALYTIPQQTRENLKNLLFTRKGERYMMPEYGTDILQSVFEPSTYELASALQESIIEAVSTWLPYIAIQNFKVVTSQDDPTVQHMVEVSFTYTVENFDPATIKILVTDTGAVTIQ